VIFVIAGLPGRQRRGDLAQQGSHHVANVLNEHSGMRAEIGRDMKLMGCRSIDELSRKNLRFG
jgi:isopentenyl diphosphate isomerase/L-lactate dehydrogenase-like FMN-dependent dehydrogenase